MNPIICRNITQAWKVKKAYEPLGWHVRIEKHQSAQNGKTCWVCQFHQNKTFNLPWHQKLINFMERISALTQKGDTHGKSRKKTLRR